MSDPLPPFEPTPDQLAHGRVVMAELIRHIGASMVVSLPRYDRTKETPVAEIALLGIVHESNVFGGALDAYGYQFEGEEDLLHLFVCRLDGRPLTVTEGQRVFAQLMPNVPPSLVWLRPGTISQHFYFGHDVLLESEDGSN